MCGSKWYYIIDMKEGRPNWSSSINWYWYKNVSTFCGQTFFSKLVVIVTFNFFLNFFFSCEWFRNYKKKCNCSDATFTTLNKIWSPLNLTFLSIIDGYFELLLNLLQRTIRTRCSWGERKDIRMNLLKSEKVKSSWSDKIQLRYVLKLNWDCWTHVSSFLFIIRLEVVIIVLNKKFTLSSFFFL